MAKKLMKKLSKKDLISLKASEIGKMKQGELRSKLRGARQLFNAQEKIFKRYEKSVFSNALENMKFSYEKSGKKPIIGMTMAEMRSELFKLQDFFQAESSTVPGARKVAIDQDRRIFGVKTESGISYAEKTGSPIARMGIDQRRSFWAAYQEFTHLHSETYVRNMGSNNIQQFLGQIVLDSTLSPDEPLDFSMEFFRELEVRLNQRKDQEEWEMSGYDYGGSDILSGKRPD